MSFGQEVKDFANAYKATSEAGESAARAKYYARTQPKDGPVFPYDPYNTDPVTGAPRKAAAPEGSAIGPGLLRRITDDIGLTSETSAIPDNPYGADAPVPNQYSRGGLVQKYDLGGPVSDPDSNAAPPQPAPPQSALPVAAPAAQPAPAPQPVPQPAPQPVPAPQPAPQPVPAPQPAPQPVPAPQPAAAIPDSSASPAAASPPPAGGSLGSALHAGMMKLIDMFGLNSPSTAVGPDPQIQQGQKALTSGAGAASHADVEEAMKAIDPQGKLDYSQKVLRVMEQGYEFYMANNEPERASNYAAMMIQYSTQRAALYGRKAAEALQSGDTKAAAQALALGYNSLPNGQSAENVRINPDSTVTVTQTDTRTGRPLDEHTLSGQQLYQAAMGLKNGTLAWQSVMHAASAAKGYAPGTSDTYNNAILALNGANPDGTLLATPGQSAPGGAAPQAASPTGAIPTPGGPAAPTAPAAPTPNAPMLAHNATPASLPKGTSPDVQAAMDPLPDYMKDYAVAMARGESSLKPGAVNVINPSSVGLFQFTPGQWQTVTGHAIPANVIGTPQDPRLNAGLSTQAFKAETQSNEIAYRKVIGSDAKPQDLAVMHQQGTAGGLRLLAAAKANPNMPAAQVIRNPQALVQNRIPANATAAQAVAAIQGHYFGGGSPAASPAGTMSPAAAAAGPDANGLLPPLPEDAARAPSLGPIPSAPKPYQNPVQISTDPRLKDHMSQSQWADYTKQVAAKNLLARQNAYKDYLSAQSQFQDQMKQYTTAAAAAKTKPEQPLPVKDRNDALTQLTAARPDPKADATDRVAQTFGGLQPDSQKNVDDIAYDVYTHNDLPPRKAYEIVIAAVNPTTRTFSAHQMPGDPDRVRMVMGGEKFVIPLNTFDEIAAVRGKEQAAAQTKQQTADKSAGRWKNVATAGGRAARAAGNIVGEAGPSLVGAMSSVGDAANRVLSHPVQTIGPAARKVLSVPARAVREVLAVPVPNG